MARSCGIRLGPRYFEIVVLDGNAKKQSIVSYTSGSLESEDGKRPADVLRAAAKSCRIPHDNVHLVIDSGFAAFRHANLPFSDPAKIEQVLKYEVEGQLPQFSIDDVVVDFHVLAKKDNASEVLVTAVPKDDLAAALELCERAGIEPLEAQLETTAVVNAAVASDICNIDDAQVLVHVGDHSTSVVVMDSGELREMRVIHIGAFTPALGAEGEEGEARASSELDQDADSDANDGVDAHELRRRTEAALRRIRRELGRTISAARTINPIEAIYVCGIDMPGLIGEPILDVPVYLLDCFDEEDGETPAESFGQLVAAYGSAITGLGGGIIRPSLRREELAFTGAWDRIEFPLAVVAMLLLTLVGVTWIFQGKQLDSLRNNGLLFWLQSSNNFLVGDTIKGTRGNMRPVPEDFRARLKRFKPAEGEPVNYDKPLQQAFVEIESDLQERVLALATELGGGTADQPQSAFVASTLVLGLLADNEERWPIALHGVKANYQKSRNSDKPDTVKVELDLVFYGPDSGQATERYEGFLALLRDQAWLHSVTQKRSDELESRAGIYVQGLPIEVNVGIYEQATLTDAPATE